MYICIQFIREIGEIRVNVSEKEKQEGKDNYNNFDPKIEGISHILL